MSVDKLKPEDLDILIELAKIHIKNVEYGHYNYFTDVLNKKNTADRLLLLEFGDFLGKSIEMGKQDEIKFKFLIKNGWIILEKINKSYIFRLTNEGYDKNIETILDHLDRLYRRQKLDEFRAYWKDQARAIMLISEFKKRWGEQILNRLKMSKVIDFFKNDNNNEFVQLTLYGLLYAIKFNDQENKNGDIEITKDELVDEINNIFPGNKLKEKKVVNKKKKISQSTTDRFRMIAFLLFLTFNGNLSPDQAIGYSPSALNKKPLDLEVVSMDKIIDDFFSEFVQKFLKENVEHKEKGLYFVQKRCYLSNFDSFFSSEKRNKFLWDPDKKGKNRALKRYINMLDNSGDIKKEEAREFLNDLVTILKKEIKISITNLKENIIDLRKYHRSQSLSLIKGKQTFPESEEKIWKIFRKVLSVLDINL